jgi:hypothetical protein
VTERSKRNDDQLDGQEEGPSWFMNCFTLASVHDPMAVFGG